MSQMLTPENNKWSQGMHGMTNRTSDVSGLEWWYRLTGPGRVPDNATFLIREQARRGRVASLLILGMLCSSLSLVPIILLTDANAFSLPWAVASAAVGLLCCLLAIPFNRSRQIMLTGTLLIVAVDVIVTGIILSQKQGLDPLFLSLFDLLAVSELVAASLLAPTSVFGIAALNILLFILDINLQPHSMMWMQMIQSSELLYSLLARSVVLYIAVAAVAYLWVQSATHALERADRAELIAELERREAEQKVQLEQAVQEILNVHVRVANGDLDARAPTYQDSLLWQIGGALNNLLSRFKISSQAELRLQRLTWEIVQLHQLLKDWKKGQILQWPTNEQTMLGPLVNDFKRALAIEAGKNPPSFSGIVPNEGRRNPPSFSGITPNEERRNPSSFSGITSNEGRRNPTSFPGIPFSGQDNDNRFAPPSNTPSVRRQFPANNPPSSDGTNTEWPRENQRDSRQDNNSWPGLG